VRKGLLAPVVVLLSLGAPLLIPGSALATGSLTIESAQPTTAGVQSGCDFTATAGGQEINVDDIENCLATGNVTITDSYAEIDVATPLTASACSGKTLALDEDGAGGMVAVDDGIDLGPACNLIIDAPGDVTQNLAITVATLALDTQGSVTLNSTTNVIGTLQGSVDGASEFSSESSVIVPLFSDPGGAVTIDSDGGIAVTGALDTSGELGLENPDSGGLAITESGGGSIAAPTLKVNATGDVSMTDAGNAVGTISASSAGGAFDFTDAESSGLELDGVVNFGGSFSIINSGSIANDSNLGFAETEGTLTSQSGAVTETTGTLGTGELNVSGTSVSLLGTNSVETLNATATAGDIDATMFDSSTSLGDISASSGAVSVTNEDTGGALQAAGAVSGRASRSPPTASPPAPEPRSRRRASRSRIPIRATTGRSPRRRSRRRAPPRSPTATPRL
jgi:hypothetical protein